MRDTMLLRINILDVHFIHSNLVYTTKKIFSYKLSSIVSREITDVDYKAFLQIYLGERDERFYKYI